MAEVNNLQDWVTSEMVRGRYIFTKEDVLGLHLPISDQALQNSLKRLTNRGIIMSPWQNFYVIIPTEYKLRGIVPPSFFIDRLMKFTRLYQEGEDADGIHERCRHRIDSP